ncbi:LuxR C-terminal-related transcriptional regulator, partial [Serratia liquefaciens]|uniref:LuxR C-terminal-related transcriptional regulator n=2 Tax=Pseudomonadota TaxID=1224 RepID=UPI003B63395B
MLETREAQRAGAPASTELSPREAEVARLYVSGLRVDEIAERLNRSKKTIS